MRRAVPALKHGVQPKARRQPGPLASARRGAHTRAAMSPESLAPRTVVDRERTDPLRVRHLRQILLWPLRLIHPQGVATKRPWELLMALGEKSPWREAVDEYTGDVKQFHERHYHEFVTFLPYVQQFLYGEGRSRRDACDPGAESPMRVFRRHDVTALRVQPRPNSAPVTLDIVHIDLYFFYDVDVVLLNVEVKIDDIGLPQAQELLYRLGRGYPAGWDADGVALHVPAKSEWLAADGSVLARSDAQERDKFLSFVHHQRAPRISAHWAWMLEPLVPDHSEREGALRYRQIEYYRMPMMAYLALNDPRALTRADFVRLGLVTGAGEAESTLPYADEHLQDFEQRFCYDRFWTDSGSAPRTRYLCSGHALIVVGDARSEFYACADRGVLAQFRHQHFLLFLIAHFQKATLLMFSDRLVEALKRLNVADPNSVKRFKRAIRGSFEGFLRFTHRYWFHEVSEQAHVRALFHQCVNHLGLDPLYTEVRDRISDMNSYLDADSLRRQANTVVRLTVVTIFGLIGTVTTGFLGMNLLAEAEAPMWWRIFLFTFVLAATIALTFYTIAKSKRLSDFLDAISDERLTTWQKVRGFFAVWARGTD
jgi:hypothetical protein